MRIHSMMFARAARLSLPGLTAERGAAASFAGGVSLAPSGRYVARFIESIVFAVLLALIALPAPASEWYGRAAPTDLEPPVISGTAQVGDVLTSTTGTWTGASSYAYQWADNGANIAGATAATYTPVSTDAGHT